MITTAGKSSTIKGCVEHSKFSANYAWKPNLVVFHNVVSMTRVLQDLIDAGYVVTPEIIARLSPAKTEHINRFGHYDLRFDRMPLPITEELRLSPAPGKVEPLC